ncbi:DNRLRE domain-containing protein [Brevibacterium luteolum]|uniref:DNRLRE domain-containing protein n=1 Tax=Brevibacterium luteolum TaxID=199591 RepID=UPI000C80F261|nr:DNRLRE domain-containing protein [Brevibacterium luteolum]
MFWYVYANRWFAVVAGVCAFVLIPSMGLPNVVEPAVAASASSSAVVPVVSRPDLVSAQVSARAQGSRVEVEDARSVDSSTFANPDGTLTTEAYSGPIRVQDDSGAWVDVDTTLEETEGGYAPKAALNDVVVSDGGEGAFASVDVDAGDGESSTFGVEWDSELGEPVVSGSTATYEGVENPFGVDADLVVEVLKDSFSHSLVLNDRPEVSEPVELRLPLDAGEGEVAADDEGRIVVRSESGQRVLSAPTPLMWGAAEDDVSGGPTRIAEVETRIDLDGDRPVLVLSPDPGFLSDPGVQYPVTIDPTFGVSTDTWVDSKLKTSQRSSKELRVGTYDGGGRKYRSYVKFDVGSLKDGKVVDAKLRMFNYYSSTCKGGQVIEAKRITSGWDSAKITWDKQPSTTTDGMGTNTQALGYSSACKGGMVDFNVTKIVEAWTTGRQANYGLQIRARNESASTAWRRYRSANHVADKQDNRSEPHLVVTWNRTPGVPSTPQIRGAVRSGSSTFTAEKRPTFESVVKDPDGGSVKFDIEVKRDSGSGANAGSCTSGFVASGQKVSCRLNADLSDNATYVVRTRSWDGKLNSAWSGWTAFKTAQATPAKPVISCPGPYGNGSWHDRPPAEDVTCTVTAAGSGNAGPNRVEVDVDHKRTTVALSDGKASVKVSKAIGGHRIDARALNVTGKTSAWAGVYTFGYGTAGITGPADGTTTTSTIRLESSAPPKGAASAVSAKVYWRLAGSGEDDRSGWTEGSSLSVRDNGAAGVSVSHLWNTQEATVAADGTKLDPRRPALLEVQICYVFTGVSKQCTWSVQPVKVVRIAHAFGEDFPTSDAGPGQVALWTGEFNTSETDVSVPGYNGDLSISRSHSTYAGATDTVRGIFGPGWSATLDGDDEAGMAGLSVIDATRSEGIIALVDDEGEPLVFQQPSQRRIQSEPGAYIPADDDTKSSGVSLTIQGAGTGAKMLVTDDEGVVTTFTPVQVSADADTVWSPASVASPGKQGTTTFTKDAEGKITRVLAGSAPGVTCAATGALAKGCRALEIEYAKTTTATDPQHGDVAGQVKQIAYTGWDPAAQKVVTIPVAEYRYDGSKRLRTVTDPRSGLATDYTYTTVKHAIGPALGSVTPAGEKTWYFHYGTVDERMRLTKVTRDPVSGEGEAETQASFVYGLDPTAGGAGLPDMTADGVAAWGQETAPAHGFAVFAADQPTEGGSAAGIESGLWANADLTYTDASGYVLNTVSYGAGGWLPTRTQYDEKYNTIGQWDTAGLQAAKEARETNAEFDVSYFATVTRYNTDSAEKNGEVPVVPAGTVVTDVFEPVAEVVLPDGQKVPARKHVHTDYDEGAPNGGMKPAPAGQPEAAKQKYLLPTTVTIAAAAADAAHSDTSIAIPEDLAVITRTKNGYDPIDDAEVTGPTSGWTLGVPTTRTTVMNNDSDIVMRTRYDERGGVVEARQPKSDGKDPRTTLTEYYSADGTGVCGNRPEWAGLKCQASPGGTPESGPELASETITAYDVWLNPVTVREANGTATRETTTTYLPDGRTDTTATTTTGVDTHALPVTKTVYDKATGRATGTQALENGSVVSETATAFDSWGRATAYTNSQGETTRTEYVQTGKPGAGQVAKTTSPAGETTYGYDGTDANGKQERRGLLTSQTISKAGSYAAAYDSGGKLIRQTMPGGVEQTSSYDINGTMTGLTYAGTITNGEDTTTGAWLSWQIDTDVLDRTVRMRAPDGRSANADDAAGDLEYTYDPAGRLIQTIDRTGATSPLPDPGTGPGDTDDSGDGEEPSDPGISPEGTPPVDAAAPAGCVVRNYTFDANSNRTALTTAAGPECGTENAETVKKTWSHDDADRITGDYTYDQLGRITKLPAGDAPHPEHGDIGIEYFADDLAAKITQGDTSTAFTLDPEGRRSQETSTTGNNSTTLHRHYSDSSDNPGWVTTGNGDDTHTTRYESSIGGDLGITLETGGKTQLTVADPSGDTVATIDLPEGDTPASGINSWANYTEYGTPGTTTTAPNTGPVTYGWLGSKERATNTSGLILMGVRLYNTTTGRFTSPDPEEGGSPTPYAYPTDPINNTDLDGKKWTWRKGVRVAVIGAGVIGALACGAAIVCGIAVGAAAGFGAYAAMHAGKRSWRWRKAAKATAFGAASGIGWGGGARAVGMRFRSKSGLSVQFTKNRGARGTTFRWKNKKALGIHSHRFGHKNGKMSKIPFHLHYRTKRAGYKRHRPWQGGFR